MGKADSKKEYQPHPRRSPESVGAEMEPMRNAGLEEVQAGIKRERKLPGEISITSDMQMTPPLWKEVKRN